MAERGGRSGWRFAAAALLLPGAILGTLAYVQRDLLAVRWHVRAAVVGAPIDDRARAWLWNHRELAVPAALRHFADPAQAAGAARMLGELLDPHGQDPDLAYLGLSTMAQLQTQYPQLPAAGRAAAADLAVKLLGWHLADRFSGVPTLLDTAGEVLGQAVGDADPDVRGAALDRMPAIWRQPPIAGPATRLDDHWRRRLCGEIARSLDSEDPAMRARAAWALVDAPAREHDDALRARLGPEEPDPVRSAAFVALASGPDEDRFGPAKTVALAYLHDGDARVRAAARALVRRQRSPREADWLLTATDPAATARAAAAASLVELARDAPAFALAGLERLAGDPQPAVRLAALDAAERWPSRAAEPLVKRLKADPDTAVSARAMKVLRNVALGRGPARQ